MRMRGKFLFLMRTRDKDYELRQDTGENADTSSEAYFADMLRLSGIRGTEEPFSVLMNAGGGKYSVIAGGLQTGRKDREGRPVRFTFLMEAGKDDAAKIFAHIVNDWDDVETLLRSCLDDDEYRRNRIAFNEEMFTVSLKDYEFENIAMPPQSNMLKWEKSSGDILELNITSQKSSAKYGKKLIIAALAAVIAVIAWVVIDVPNDDDLPPMPEYDEAVALKSELSVLSWDIHTRYMAADKEYEDLGDELDRYLRRDMTSADLARINEIVPLKERAGTRRAELSADIASLKEIYSDFMALSSDSEKLHDIAGKIVRLKQE